MLTGTLSHAAAAARGQKKRVGFVTGTRLVPKIETIANCDKVESRGKRAWRDDDDSAGESVAEWMLGGVGGSHSQGHVRGVTSQAARSFCRYFCPQCIGTISGLGSSYMPPSLARVCSQAGCFIHPQNSQLR